MEFCPTCKNMLLPRNKGNKTILVCRICGHEVKKFREKEYTITEDSQRARKEIAIVEESEKKDVEDQRGYMEDLYGTDVEFEE